MSANMQTLRRWIDAINRADIGAIEAFVHPEIVDHHLPVGLPAGSAGVALWCSILCDALQLQVVIEDAVEENDRIAVRATLTGRQVADFMGLPATDRAFTAPMMSVERFEQGLIVERWELVDTAVIMQQLTGAE